MSRTQRETGTHRLQIGVPGRYKVLLVSAGVLGAERTNFQRRGRKALTQLHAAFTVADSQVQSQSFKTCAWTDPHLDAMLALWT